MNSRAWLWLLLFIVWSLGSGYWYVCKIKGYCAEPPAASQDKGPPEEKPITEELVEPEPAIKYGPLTFAQGRADPLTDERWSDYVQTQIARGTDGQVLSISGPYYDGESAPDPYENMGLARADRLKSMLADQIDTSQVEISSHSMGALGEAPDRFGETRFSWLTKNDKVQESVTGTLIYFPYNSDKQISDPDILAYLNQLAEQVSASGQSLSIIGHTDSRGDQSSNMLLGQKRADSIKRYLESRGVKSEKIEALSKGESEPIANNINEAGRKLNRRTEIVIHQ